MAKTQRFVPIDSPALPLLERQPWARIDNLLPTIMRETVAKATTYQDQRQLNVVPAIRLRLEPRLYSYEIGPDGRVASCYRAISGTVWQMLLTADQATQLVLDLDAFLQDWAAKQHAPTDAPR